MMQFIVSCPHELLLEHPQKLFKGGKAFYVKQTLFLLNGKVK